MSAIERDDVETLAVLLAAVEHDSQCQCGEAPGAEDRHVQLATAALRFCLRPTANTGGYDARAREAAVELTCVAMNCGAVRGAVRRWRGEAEAVVDTLARHPQVLRALAGGA